MSEGPIHTISVSAKLHSLADAGHHMTDLLRAAADKAQHAFETWLLAAEHTAHVHTEEARAATKHAWDAFGDARAQAADLLARARQPV